MKPFPYDPSRAKALLAESGWMPDATGRLMKNGKPFAFTLMTNQGNKVRELCAVVIQEQLKKVGIDVSIRIMEWSTFIHQYIDKKTSRRLSWAGSWDVTRTTSRCGILPAEGRSIQFLWI